MKKRDLDGIYFRVEREGKWENRCFSDLYPFEQEKVLAKYSYDGIATVIKVMGERMADIAENALELHEARQVAIKMAEMLRDIGDRYSIEGE